MSVVRKPCPSCPWLVDQTAAARLLAHLDDVLALHDNTGDPAGYTRALNDVRLFITAELAPPPASRGADAERSEADA